ncbi:MAG: hypothetical protein A3F80_06125 [Candidatus Melainabacteria bacterium RIFCSPLOWO2_12_FULL_35_11]|nr:MAG: hypothetical protein A3F80_06125 [Candidatus Melainabacteria bacterium RIFCSPLOWO2_12_FULL_35_11]
MKTCIKCKCDLEQNIWDCAECGYKPKLKGGKLILSIENNEQNNIGFEDEFFDRLIKIEENSFWFRARNKLIIWTLKNYFPNIKNFFEVGCGTGFVLSGISNAFSMVDLYGSEGLVKGLKFASNRVPKAILFQMDARNIPFKEEFEVIGAFDMLEHISGDKLALEQMYKAIKPGGGLILTVPQHKFLWSKLDEFGHHFRRYSLQELKAKVESCGFKIVRMTSFVTFLLPLFFLSRLRFQIPGSKKDNISEFNLNKYLNFLLEKVLDLERFFIKSGVSFPIGSSLLLVARK